MIVSCPHCSARFRVDDEKLTEKKVSLRCARCRKVFPIENQLSAVQPSSAIDNYVLVAHSDPVLCQTIGELLSRHEVGYQVASDGEAALSLMDQRPPVVAVVDVALPGLYAFEVVEKVRSRAGLENVKIILLSSVYNKMAYKCRPTSLYGADDYLEKHHIPDTLMTKIKQLSEQGSVATGLGAAPKVSAPDDWDVVNESIRQAEEQEISTSDHSQAIEKARRLARIIVSDISLYNQGRVEEGIASGRFYEMFATEIAEGKTVFAERVSPEINAREDFLMDAFAEFIAKRQQELSG